MSNSDILKSHKQEAFQRLSVLIVLPGEYKEALHEALQIDNRESYDERLEYYFCEYVEELAIWVNDQGGKSPDYIFIVINPTIRTCLDMTEEVISKIDRRYIQGGRLCLVNGHCSAKPNQEMAVPMGTINVISQKYSILLINGDVMIPDKCKHLATRLSSLATSVCGYTNGIPISLDLPGYQFG